jgi:hypothetical protein
VQRGVQQTEEERLPIESYVGQDLEITVDDEADCQVMK